MQTVFADLADLHGNTADGVHLAGVGGVWMAIVYGFAGFRFRRGSLYFDPRLPSAWGSLRFRLRHPSGLLEVEVNKDGMSLLNRGGATSAAVRDHEVHLEDGQAVTFGF